MAARAERGDALATYRAKRRFRETPEPSGGPRRKAGHGYLIQKHAARRLHYDFRLELDGVLKSWAVTKGPSLDPAQKRLAVRTEDHPLDYGSFEGTIPAGNYGAGTVLLWDRGSWEPLGDPHKGLASGKLTFRLRGERLQGKWALIRLRAKERERENWLLIKERDDEADEATDLLALHQTSVTTGRRLEEITAGRPANAEKAKKAKVRSSTRKKPPGFSPLVLATLVDSVPTGKNWVFEIKFDGYRTLLAAGSETVRFYTRTGLDWTERFASLVPAAADLGLDQALLDGEVVVVDAEGRSDFSALQQALRDGNRPLAFFAFDLLELRGKSLRSKPLLERKKRLEQLLGKAGREGPIFYADHIAGDGETMLATLCDKGFEGIIAKRGDAAYHPGRGRDWLKIKCEREQEFVIVGYSSSSRGLPFASLLLAVQENGALRYAGRVGAGFSQDERLALSRRFRKLRRTTPPVKGVAVDPVTRSAHWLRPELVAQIEFSEFTADGIVRHARFVGLREDKPAEEVRREEPEALETVASRKKQDQGRVIAGVTLSHPDRVLYPQQGITKLDLARYLEAAAPRMLSHVAKRLLSLVRCPEGSGKECFFQRHGGAGLSGDIERLPVKEKDGGKADYLYVTDERGLVATAQMGVLELHLWGSHIDDIERPDRLVFDLDPAEDVTFPQVKQAALDLREVLASLDLQSFPLLTGGKGIHLVLPIRRRYDWPVIKAFTRALAERMAEHAPEHYVAVMSKAKRKGRIFLDYLRNERGATAISPYSVRARANAPVAWPVTWRELPKIASPAAITLPDALELLSSGKEPWQGYFELRQEIKKSALRALSVG